MQQAYMKLFDKIPALIVVLFEMLIASMKNPINMEGSFL